MSFLYLVYFQMDPFQNVSEVGAFLVRVLDFVFPKAISSLYHYLKSGDTQSLLNYHVNHSS